MNKMAITYTSIITLNVNRLNPATKRHRLAEWMKQRNKQTRIYAAYKGLTSDLETHTGWK